MKKSDCILRHALRQGVAIAIGVTLGGVLIPRLLFPERYIAMPLWEQTLIYLIVSFLVGAAVTLLCDSLFPPRDRKRDSNDEIE
jgi:hypothetical protein